MAWPKGRKKPKAKYPRKRRAKKTSPVNEQSKNSKATEKSPPKRKSKRAPKPKPRPKAAKKRAQTIPLDGDELVHVGWAIKGAMLGIYHKRLEDSNHEYVPVYARRSELGENWQPRKEIIY